MKKLNLGCGNRFLKDWINFDFVSNSPYVKEHDLSKGIPCEDNCFDFVYHSHVLEHFSKQMAIEFMTECHRVLVPGGIIRVVVPDLEMLANNYINTLKEVYTNTSEENVANYEWSIIELLDQMVRTVPGGEMMKYWNKDIIINENLLTDRLGHEFLEYRQSFNLSKGSMRPKVKSEFLNKLKNTLKLKKRHGNVKDFRKSGEIHQWMYDRFSLNFLLKNVGFGKIKVVNADESSFFDWNECSFLDMQDGQVRKPDSLFMEAFKQ